MKIKELKNIIKEASENLLPIQEIISIKRDLDLYKITVEDATLFNENDNIKIYDTNNFNIDEVSILSKNGNDLFVSLDFEAIEEASGKIKQNNPFFIYGEYEEINNKLTTESLGILLKNQFIILELPLNIQTSGDDKYIFNQTFDISVFFAKTPQGEEAIEIQSEMQEIALKFYTLLNAYKKENIFAVINSIEEITFSQFKVSDTILTGISSKINITFFNSLNIE